MITKRIDYGLKLFKQSSIIQQVGDELKLKDPTQIPVELNTSPGSKTNSTHSDTLKEQVFEPIRGHTNVYKRYTSFKMDHESPKVDVWSTKGNLEVYLSEHFKIKGFFRTSKIAPYVKTSDSRYEENYRIEPALTRDNSLEKLSGDITALIQKLELTILEMRYFLDSMFLLCQKKSKTSDSVSRFFFMEIYLDKEK